jgi:leucyl/phenylalanyl-tRNA--protein transferase
MSDSAPLPWPPIEPPKARVQFPDLSRLGDEWVVGVTRTLNPGLVLQAYRAGIFPWPSKPGVIPWASPEPRTLFPLEKAGHWSRSVRRDLKKADERWLITFDTAFAEVMRACAERPGEGTWIIDDLFATYVQLHLLGWGHSIEVWGEPDTGGKRRLIGGLYGLAVGALFAGESMFHRETGASKVAFAKMAEHLVARGFRIFDVQAHSEHLSSLGCVEVTRADFLAQMRMATAIPTRF